MLSILRTTPKHPHFVELVRLLDTDLQLRDGEEHSFYAQFNSAQDIKYAVVAYLDGKAVGCGAIKEFSDGVMEIKRMFVKHDYRGKGIAGAILDELERWAMDLSAIRCILETGKNQPEAIALYTKHQYKLISNFGQYKDAVNSVCFEKVFVGG